MTAEQERLAVTETRLNDAVRRIEVLEGYLKWQILFILALLIERVAKVVSVGG